MDDRTRTPITVTSYEDILARIAHFDSFSIGGRLYTSEYLIRLLAINVKDALEEAATTPALVLYWGRESARARRIKADVDHQYKVWRERAFTEAKATPVVGSEKFPTDRQAEAVYRTLPAYSEWKRRIADAQEAAENAEGVYEALRVKQFLLKVEADLLRDEAGGPYIVLEEDSREVPRQPMLSNPVGEL